MAGQSALSLPVGMVQCYGIGHFFNDVDVRVKSAKGEILKVVPVSSLLLVSYSPKFKAELMNWQINSAVIAGDRAPEPDDETPLAKRLRSDHNDLSADPAPTITSPCSSVQPLRRFVSITAEDEVDVSTAEVCLRFMYTGSLPSTAQPAQLLAIYRMADYLGIMECCAACMSALCLVQPQELSVADAALIGYSDNVPEDMRSVQLKRLCLHAILHHLGDVVEVMRSEELTHYWCELPVPALLDLLRSDMLATDSEDSVVAAVSVWADHQASIPVHQQQQLVAELRLLQLSSTFFHYVLPLLAWCHEDVLPAFTLLRLAAYVQGDSAAKNFASRTASKGQPMPVAWTSTTPRPWTAANGIHADTAVLRCTVLSRQQLEEGVLPRLSAAAAAGQRDRVRSHAQAPAAAVECLSDRSSAEMSSEGDDGDSSEDERPMSRPQARLVSRPQPPEVVIRQYVQHERGCEWVHSADRIFAHGCSLQLCMRLSRNGSVGMYTQGVHSFRLRDDDRYKAAWRLQTQLFMKTPGDIGADYSHSLEMHDMMASEGACVGFDKFYSLAMGQPITHITSWERKVLWQDSVRAKVSVKASTHSLQPGARGRVAPRLRMAWDGIQRVVVPEAELIVVPGSAQPAGRGRSHSGSWASGAQPGRYRLVPGLPDEEWE